MINNRYCTMGLSRYLIGCMTLIFAMTMFANPPGKQANVILIVVESLRSDHVGYYGYSRDTTPTLDALAADGVTFRRAFTSSGWTMPSVMTLMTSLLPSKHGAVGYRHALFANKTTLADEFKRGGYRTAGIVANPTLSGRYGFRRGFDLYDDFTILSDIPVDGLAGYGEVGSVHTRSTSADTTRLALSWLAARKADPLVPFFLFLFYFDPHYDYTPPPPYNALFTCSEYAGQQDGRGITQLRGSHVNAGDRAQIKALYDGEIRCVDDQIGRLMAELRRLELYDNSVVVITGDHGEEFWDHDSVAHGHTLYDELLHVPLIMRIPGGEHAGVDINADVGLIDLMPTLLEMVGLPAVAQCQGRSLMPLLNGQELIEVPLISETVIEGVYSSVRLGGRKVILRYTAAADIPMLFDLGTDPGELKDLAGTHRESEFEPLLSLLRARGRPVGEKPESGGSKAPPLDSVLLKQLKSLGYVK